MSIDQTPPTAGAAVKRQIALAALAAAAIVFTYSNAAASASQGPFAMAGAGNRGAAAAHPSAVRQAMISAQTSRAPVQLSGSLFKQGLMMANASGRLASIRGASPIARVSYFAVPKRSPRKLRKHDLITIIIRENSDSATTGQMDSQKQQAFDAAVQQFMQLRFSGGNVPYVTSVSNPSALPEVKVQYNNTRKNNATDQRVDQFSARITAEIIDIKPNGNLVVEATKHIRVDSETQTFRLSGECRARDVSVDNTILSTQMADLRLSKKTHGAVRAGTKRGWLNKVIDAVNPF